LSAGGDKNAAGTMAGKQMAVGGGKAPKCNTEGGVKESAFEGGRHLGRSRSSADRERDMIDLSPGGLKGSKRDCRTCPPTRYPLIKTEYIYEDNSDNCPQVITTEIPFMASELAKLQKDFARTARELDT